ncbi:MAG: sn-glycerol-3-phosphate ABC transporter ATP-binding protein UgpC [Deltaproteobacteria bacterium]|nr:MAG: sn-glycerol-3-phosphate ABC transporter ATP-binding protein UgpC [Deltaproteobacteria bacterium]
MAGLEVRGLSKSFGDTRILEEISFDVAEGEFCVLLGPSGCGKTTLLRLVAGLEAPSTGTISIGDKRIDPLPPRERDIAFVFQSYALYPHMNVFDNLAFSLRLRGFSKQEIQSKVTEAARLLELEAHLERKPQELSGGQRQRVAVGRAIVRRPKIFLFDEPLSNLDAALRAGMRIELAQLHRKLQATILYVTHDQAEAMTLGEKIMVLDKGKLQQMGNPSAIYHKPANTFVARFVGSPQMNLIEGKLDDKGIVFRAGESRIDLSGALSGHGADYAAKDLTVGIRPEDFHPTAPDGAWIRGEVEIVEDLGSDKFVHIRSGHAKLVARIAPDVGLNRGEILGLAAAPNRLHLFSNGKRINK